MKLLTTSNPKTAKGANRGYSTAILHLAPSKLASAALGRIVDVCPWSTAGCRQSCLNTAGRGGIIRKGEHTNAIQQARIARTMLFFTDRKAFLLQLEREIGNHVRLSERHGLKPAVRLNGTSDLPWESIASSLFAVFHDVQFYDYTKSPERAQKVLPPNYHLTFSQAEDNETDARRVLRGGGNVATVFRKVPTNHLGYIVTDGDASDLRFLDRPGTVVGLKAKGKAKRDTTGFVLQGVKP